MRVAPLFVMILAIPCLAQEPAAKKMLPDDAAQKAALSVVADVYKPDYENAKTPAQKIELAKKLLGEGVATKDDPVNRFVLFRIARDIAAQQGDLTTAFSAIGRINAEYEADRMQMQIDAATTATKALKLAKDHQACAALLAPLIDEAISVDRYDHAKSLAALTLGAAREGRDTERIKQLTSKTKEIEEIAAEFEKVKEAKVALEAKPTDPDANFAVGRFLCLVKGDWQRGVTMLALGSNEDFKATALLELEEKPDPLKLGDGWWKIAEGLEATAKSRAQIHAAEWYRKALPGLSGLSKTRVERLVSQVATTSSKIEATTSLNYLGKQSIDKVLFLDYINRTWHNDVRSLFRVVEQKGAVQVSCDISTGYEGKRLMFPAESVKSKKLISSFLVEAGSLSEFAIMRGDFGVGSQSTYPFEFKRGVRYDVAVWLNDDQPHAIVNGKEIPLSVGKDKLDVFGICLSRQAKVTFYELRFEPK